MGNLWHSCRHYFDFYLMVEASSAEQCALSQCKNSLTAVKQAGWTKTPPHNPQNPRIQLQPTARNHKTSKLSHSKPQQVRSILKHRGDIHSICQGVIMLWPDTPVTLESAFAHKKACEDAEGWSCGQFGIFLRRTSLKNALSNTQPQAENVTAFQKDPQ